jgi:hypothetical protein
MSLTFAEMVALKRADETARRYTKTRFKREASSDNKAKVPCGAPGCGASTRTGFCKKHWRLRAAMKSLEDT